MMFRLQKAENQFTKGSRKDSEWFGGLVNSHADLLSVPEHQAYGFAEV